MKTHAPAHCPQLPFGLKALLSLALQLAAACGSGESAPPGAAPGGAAMAPASPAPVGSSSCAGADACASCLCSACTDEVERCAQTPGCLEILACARSSGCGGMDCYCGSADALSCLNGKADGACRAAIETAPGGRAPTVREPSAGPAADGASALAQCLQREDACRSACAVQDLAKQ
ncbi:MAG TPA: hypothetical protein VFS67_26450 [Polyangiaceae bacterium]|nr:hypothetical protein [Polyangiaceae bacterium]